MCGGRKEIREIRVCGSCGREVGRRVHYSHPQKCPFCGGPIITKYVTEVK